MALPWAEELCSLPRCLLPMEEAAREDQEEGGGKQE